MKKTGFPSHWEPPFSFTTTSDGFEPIKAVSTASSPADQLSPFPIRRVPRREAVRIILPQSTDSDSRLPIPLRATSTGKRLACVFESVDEFDVEVIPVTAYPFRQHLPKSVDWCEVIVNQSD